MIATFYYTHAHETDPTICASISENVHVTMKYNILYLYFVFSYVTVSLIDNFIYNCVTRVTLA